MSPRQLVNASGAVTFAARYTPWGDTLESSGTGNISIGYLGGLMDTATGLLYMGNGNYYDPSTGRFLNRNVNPNGTNPYVPWGGNPTGAVITPLALLSLVYTRKKKRGTLDTIIILLVLGVSLSLGLTACGGGTVKAPGLTATWGPSPAQPQNYNVTVTATTITGQGTITETLTPVGTPQPCVTLPRPTFIFLFCGRGLTCGTGQSLSPYYTWAKSLGYETKTIGGGSSDVACSGKASCAREAEGIIANLISSNANAAFVLIGHSAGADTAVLVAHDELGRANMKGVVLLDPTLSASPDYPNVNDMDSIASNIATQIPLFLADTPNDWDTNRQPIFAYIKGARYGASAIYNPSITDHAIYPNIQHLDLANNQAVFRDVLAAMGWCDTK